MPAKRKLFLQLRHKIEDAGYTNSEFAAELGIGAPLLSARLSGRTPWTMAEALKACDLLEIPPEDLCGYFADAAAAASRREAARC